ncbi:C6 finger domain-containing protein [Fusarium austroafricanum]|uniref:C6 finger domain-containing protein n=1 Tax=Fusarium austroafricanum TaxID=2364996 RepID=A0A8H4KJ00_9HYPO|nr:C6 finger domain-containing protein [Fusarium austroafricanum]
MQPGLTKACIQCDEGWPCCRNCECGGRHCIYDRDQPTPVGHHDTKELSEPVESAERRETELQLLHFYIVYTGPSIAFEVESSNELYVKAIPEMALKSKSLLYTLFAISALHQSKLQEQNVPSTVKSPGDNRIENQHSLYMRLAFQHHRRGLSNITSENIDILFLTSQLLRVLAWFVLSERELEPYQPPVEWFHVAKSHCQLWTIAWDMAKSNETALVLHFVRTTPCFWWKTTPKGSDGGWNLDYVLDSQLDDIQGNDNPETWGEEALEACKWAINYINNILGAIEEQESFGLIARSILFFPVLAPDGFIALVGQRKPRPLVILAHYFALLTSLQRFWYIGDTGAREVEAIHHFCRRAGRP